MKNEVVQNYEDGPRAGTFLIAKGFNREHNTITRLIEKYQEDFENFSVLKTRKIMTKGRPIIEYWLSESQTMLLGTYLRNNIEARAFKIKLIQEFENLKKQNKALKKHQEAPVYSIARAAGKLVRKDTTDIMKEFIKYAKEQGSTNADWYYNNITVMMNGLLFIAEGKYKNLRTVMSIKQLMTTSSAEQIIDRGLRNGMDDRMFYKDIFQDVKKRVILFAELHGQSEIIQKQLDLFEK